MRSVTAIRLFGIAKNSSRTSSLKNVTDQFMAIYSIYAIFVNHHFLYRSCQHLCTIYMLTLASVLGTQRKTGTSGIMPKVPGGIAAISIFPLPLDA